MSRWIPLLVLAYLAASALAPRSIGCSAVGVPQSPVVAAGTMSAG